MGLATLLFALLTAAIAWLAFRHGKSDAPPARPANALKAPPNPDHWEGAFWDAETPKPTDILVHLLYQDGAGQRTKRTVRVTGFDSDAGGLIIGHCMLRNERRTFRYDRIERAIDPSTGEVIGDLHAWLEDRYRNTPQGIAATLTNEHMDLFKVLLYVAKADGAMRAAEVAAIASAAADITGNAQIDSAVAKAALNPLDAPTMQGFKLAFGRLIAKDRAAATKILDAAKAIVSTQKTAHASEQAALDYLQKALSKGQQ